MHASPTSFLAAAVLLAGPLAAQEAVTVSSRPIRIAVIEANADARVQGGAPTANYPTGDLWVGLPDKTVFLHFGLHAIPAGSAIMGAELLLNFKDSYSEQGPNTIRLGGVQDPWSETTVTYDNQPDVVWSNRASTVSGPGTISFDVKPAVVAWFSGQKPNRGLALRGDGPLKNAFSREASAASERPRLRIRYVAP
jgi:hypothetical protein